MVFIKEINYYSRAVFSKALSRKPYQGISMVKTI